MIEITQGERKEIIIRVRDSEGDPIDFTSLSSAKVCLLKNDNTYLDVALTPSGSPLIGKLSGVVTAANSDLLKPINGGNAELHMDFGGGDVRIKQLKGAVTVHKGLC